MRRREGALHVFRFGAGGGVTRAAEHHLPHRPPLCRVSATRRQTYRQPGTPALTASYSPRCALPTPEGAQSSPSIVAGRGGSLAGRIPYRKKNRSALSATRDDGYAPRIDGGGGGGSGCGSGVDGCWVGSHGAASRETPTSSAKRSPTDSPPPPDPASFQQSPPFLGFGRLLSCRARTHSPLPHG